MIRKMFRLAVIALLVVVLTATTAFADSYTYNFKREPVATPEAVAVKLYVDSAYAGWGKLNAPEDMDISARGQILIADTGNNRLVLLDGNYKFIREITEFEGPDGRTETLKAPKGVFFSDNGWLYIADSGNNRVLVVDENYKIKLEMRASAEETLKQGFVFTPLKVAADKAGRTYVIADGVYDGLMEFDPQGKFLGFSGANRVRPNMADLFWNAIGTEEQRKRRLKNVPTEFNNLDMDAEGFVYTVTASVDQWNPASSDPVRRQTAMGLNILRYNNILGKPVGDLVFPYTTEDASIKGPSRLMDISANEDYGYACLDVQRGRVFVYNNEGEMMFAFGGKGSSKGFFTLPSAIVCKDNDISVLDTTLGTITVFTFSDYAQKIISAQENYLNGHYEQAKSDWFDVLKINSNLDMAYSGLGKIYIREGRYKEAMEYLKLGGNKEYYSKAFRLYREEHMTKAFVYYFLAAVAIIVLLILYVKLWRPKLKARTGLKKYAWYRGLKYGFHIMTHPFDGFWDMVYEKRGNMISAMILYGLFILTNILDASFSGFLFKPLNDKFNILAVIAASVVPAALWCLSNWSVTTLFNGDGKFSTIVMAVGYVLLPYILVKIPVIVLSNVATLEESALLNVIQWGAIVWCAFLMFAGMLTIHDYTPKQTVGTMALTVIGMAAIVFLAVLLVNLVQQLVVFLIGLYYEVVIRL